MLLKGHIRFQQTEMSSGVVVAPFPVSKEYPNCPASRPKAKKNCASFMPTENKGVTGAVP
jgi:hypothetical protein